MSRVGARRTHVLLVEVPGGWTARVAAERVVVHRGLVLAESPADADLLAVCGVPGPETSDLVERIWDQLPGPRSRCDLTDPETAGDALDAAVADLVDGEHQRRDDHGRTSPDAHGHGDGQDGMGDMEHGDMGHMSMSPDGIPLAEGADDRDGLEMDVLHVGLGPLLPHWPPGLVLACELHGDVIASAEARILDPPTPHEDGLPMTRGDAGRDRAGASTRAWAALRCDSAAHVLALAGWPDGAARARHVRDVLLGQDTIDSGARLLEDLAWSVARSRMLRWSLRRIRPVSLDDIVRLDLPRHLVGDVADRLGAMLARARAELGEQELPPPDGPTRCSPDQIARLVSGLDLATARLVVASLDLDPVPSAQEASRA